MPAPQSPSIDLSEVARVSARNKARKFPQTGDERVLAGTLFPLVNPKFPLELGPDVSVFTIGSCFARNIEEALEGVKLPTRAFSVPPSEWPYYPNSLLNEYTPATMAQRIHYALEGRSFPEETMAEGPQGFADLLLAGGNPVSRERALQRRTEIDAVYRELPKSPYVIITLGHVEAWFDGKHGVYLNRMPPASLARKEPSRFVFRRLDVFDVYPMLSRAFAALADLKIKVVLTLSPVPIAATFTDQDCVVANEFSKAVLRVVAERLSRHFGNVDYFPSYEIARSAGLASYGPDNRHVKDDVVRMITKHMLASYCRPVAASRDPSP